MCLEKLDGGKYFNLPRLKYEKKQRSRDEEMPYNQNRSRYEEMKRGHMI
jgi:hypothetical protein